MMRAAVRMMAAGMAGFPIARFGFAGTAEGERSRAHDQGAGQEEREGSFHAIAVGGGTQKSQSSFDIR